MSPREFWGRRWEKEGAVLAVRWLVPAPVGDLLPEFEGLGISREDLALACGEGRDPMRVRPGYVSMQFQELRPGTDGMPQPEPGGVIWRPDGLFLIAREESAGARRLRERLDEARSAPDLLFLFWDGLLEQYHAAKEQAVRQAEEVARRVIVGPRTGLGGATYRVRREAFTVRQTSARLKTAIARLEEEQPADWPEPARKRCHEVLERAEGVYADIEAVRDGLGETVEAYSSVQSNELNHVMQVLTIVSLLFLPATLIASIYGMNFRIPEYHWAGGYAWSLGLMALLTAGTFVWARIRGFLR